MKDSMNGMARFPMSLLLLGMPVSIELQSLLGMSGFNRTPDLAGMSRLPMHAKLWFKKPCPARPDSFPAIVSPRRLMLLYQA